MNYILCVANSTVDNYNIIQLACSDRLNGSNKHELIEFGETCPIEV